MAEFLGVGDLHLSDASGTGGLSKYVAESDSVIFSEFDQVLEYGRKKGINKCIQYGDVCDNPRMSYPALLALTEFLNRNDDFTFYFLLGNHDMFGETTATGHSLEVLKLLYHKPNVRFVTGKHNVLIDGMKLRLLSYPHRDFDAEALNVFHGEVHGSKNDAGRSFENDELTKSKAVILAGHLHTAHRIRNTYYAGTLYQTNFGESLPKYFHHIEFNSASDYEVRLVKHDPVYKLHNVVLQSREDLAEIPEGKFNLVKLVIQDGCDVSASDYAKFTNIVEHKNFKTKEDLAAVLTEDLSEGHAVTFKVSEFFSAWIESYDVPEPMRDRIKQTRRRVLNTVKAK